MNTVTIDQKDFRRLVALATVAIATATRPDTDERKQLEVQLRTIVDNATTQG